VVEEVVQSVWTSNERERTKEVKKSTGDLQLHKERDQGYQTKEDQRKSENPTPRGG